MRAEFQRAIAFDEDLDKVNSQLRADTEKHYQRLSKRINDDYQSALLIRAGLKEPAGTQIHKLAKAYYDTYRKNNLPKEADGSTGKSIAELLQMESEALETELQINEVLAGKDEGKDETDNGSEAE